MAEVNLTAAFSTVPAAEAEEIKRVIVETVGQIAQEDGTFKRAKLVFTESDERCGLTAELDGVKKEGVPLQLDLEQFEVELEWNAFLLHPVELRRQSAPLVGFGEDELRPLERAVLLGDLPDGLDDDTLDLLGLRRRHRGERRGQINFRHRSTPSGCPHASSPRSREWRS